MFNVLNDRFIRWKKERQPGKKLFPLPPSPSCFIPLVLFLPPSYVVLRAAEDERHHADFSRICWRTPNHIPVYTHKRRHVYTRVTLSRQSCANKLSTTLSHSLHMQTVSMFSPYTPACADILLLRIQSHVHAQWKPLYIQQLHSLK